MDSGLKLITSALLSALGLAACGDSLHAPTSCLDPDPCNVEPSSASEPGGYNDPSAVAESQLAECTTLAAPDRRLTRFELAYAIEDVFALDASALHTLARPSGGIGERPDIVVGEMLDAGEQFITAYREVLQGLTLQIAQQLLRACGEEPVLCLRAQLQQAAERLWRRTTTSAERSRWQSRLSATPQDLQPAVQDVVLELLMSSEFYLLRNELVQPTLQEANRRLISRLALVLWSSVPDAELLELATSDRLAEPDVWEAQLARMQKDPRFGRFAHEFSRQWLSLDRPALFRASLESRELLEDRDYAAQIHSELSTWLQASLQYSLSRLLYEQADADQETGLLTSAALLSTLSTAIPNGGDENWLGRGMQIQAALLCRDWPLASAYPLELWEGHWLVDPHSTLPRPGEPALLQLRNQEHTCGQCHRQLETFGAKLWMYDGLGRALPEGTANPYPQSTPDGPSALRTLILQSGRFESCVAQKLSSYVLARSVAQDSRREDRCLVQTITAPEHDVPLSLDSLLRRLLHSTEFLAPSGKVIAERTRPSPNSARYSQPVTLPEVTARDCAEFDANRWLQRSCGTAQCHAAGSPSGVFVAEDAALTRQLLLQAKPTPEGFCSDYEQYVNPANPDESLLLQKVLGGSETCGAPMPLTGGARSLAPTDLACFARWVNEFAQH